jgi:cytochrome c oxidase subunit 2
MNFAKTKKTLFLSSLALASALALSACGGKDSAPSPAPSESAPAATESAAPAEGQTIEVTVEASNFAFEPAEIKAKVGDTIKLTLKNKSGLHGLAVDGLNVDIKDGETATIVLDKAGTFEYYCSIMCGAGHDNMTGKIIVEE